MKVRGNSNKMYAWGLFISLFGGAGLAEHITSGRGNFIVSAIVFSIGLGLIIGSYEK